MQTCLSPLSFHQSYHLRRFIRSSARMTSFLSSTASRGSTVRVVSRARLNVFPQNAPSVLDGRNDRILVWIIHDGGTQLHSK
jgi:hypothetical protein